MKHAEWTENHDRLLAGSSPHVEEPAEAELARVWNRVETGLTPHEARQGRRWWVTAGVGVGAVVLATSGIAAADLFSARTGHGPSDQEDAALGGPGERLDPAAPDYGDVIAQEIVDIPFPTDSAREFAIADQVNDARSARPGAERVSTGAIRAWIADAAVCAWSNQWAAATRDGDSTARGEAIEVIDEAASWPAVVAIDPTPYSRLEPIKVLGPDGNVVEEMVRDESQFYYLGALRDAMEGTEPGVVAAILREDNGYCRPELVPDLPKANPMHQGR